MRGRQEDLLIGGEEQSSSEHHRLPFENKLEIPGLLVEDPLGDVYKTPTREEVSRKYHKDTEDVISAVIKSSLHRKGLLERGGSNRRHGEARLQTRNDARVPGVYSKAGPPYPGPPPRRPNLPLDNTVIFP